MNKSSGLGFLAGKMSSTKKVEYNEDAIEEKKRPAVKEKVEERPKKTKLAVKAIDSIVELDPHDIVPWKYDDRSEKEIERSLEKMIASIQSNGQDSPILVRRKGQKYEEIYGRRRLEACKVLGRKVKAEIRDLDDAAAMASQIIENKDRENISAWSRALSYKKVMDEGIYESIAAFAVRCNLNRSTVSNLVNTANRMPEKIVQELDLTYLGQNALLLICGYCESHPAFVEELLLKKAKIETESCGPSTIKGLFNKWVESSSQASNSKRTIKGKHGDYFTLTINNNGALLINVLKKGRELMSEEEITDLLRDALDSK